MSITDSFDPVGKPLITPAAAYLKSPYSLDVCVINFSQKIMDALTDDGVVELLEAERIVAEAERLHGRDRSAGRGRAERPEKQRRTHGWAAAFVAGLFAGMAAAFLICLVLYILRT